MADQFRDQINTARRAGFGDDELIGYLKDKDPRVSTALEKGFQPKEILEYLAPSLSTGEEFGRKVGVAARGVTEALTPVAAGALGGAALGAMTGVAAPFAVPVGALAGSLAVPTADALAMAYNKLAGGNVRLPSQVISGMIPGPRAETPVERVLQSSAGALTSTGGSVIAGRGLSQLPQVLTQNQVVGNLRNRPASAFTAQPMAPGLQAIGREASRLPVAQVVTAPIATAVGQSTTELTNNPLAGLVAGVATGTAAGLRPTKRTAVPTADELTAKSKANYEVLDNSRFELDNQQFVNHMSGMPSKLRTSAGYDPRVMPDVDAALVQLTSGNPKTVQELDTLRTIIGNAAKSTKPAERKAASQLLDEFDSYVMNAPAGATVIADKAATQAWKDARADYAKMKKSEMITDILEKADVSQGSKEASIASQLSLLAKNDKKMRFFTPDEQEAIRQAAKGGTLQQLLRTIAKFTPMTPAAAIFTAVSPIGAYTAGAGMAAKSLAESRRARDVNRLGARMRLGEQPTVLESPYVDTPVFFSRSAQNMLGPTQQNQNALAR